MLVGAHPFSLDFSPWSGARDGFIRVELSQSPPVDPKDPIPIDPESNLGICDWDLARRTLTAHGITSPEGAWSACRLACVISAWLAGGLAFHSAGLLGAGRAFLALAPSGGGKSTLTDLAQGFDSLADETCFVDLARGLLVSTPFRSAARKAPVPACAPLAALLLLEKSPEPKLIPIDPGLALPRVAAQLYRPPASMASSAQVFSRVHELVKRVPAYRFLFPKDSDAATRLLREVP